MSDLAIAFLGRWIEENVSTAPGDRQQAMDGLDELDERGNL